MAKEVSNAGKGVSNSVKGASNVVNRVSNAVKNMVKWVSNTSRKWFVSYDWGSVNTVTLPTNL